MILARFATLGARRGSPLLALAVAGALCLACGGPRPEPRAKSVVIVDIDTLRADRLSAYGFERDTSPHLDRLAGEGTRFAWAFSQAPYTLPSQTSILTSLYPSRHGVFHDGDRLADDAATLAETFRERGFATAAFVDGGYMKPVFGLDQGFDLYQDLNGGGLAVGEEPIARWLREHRDRPFFLLVHTYDTHTPYAPPEPFRSRFEALVEPPTAGFVPDSATLEAIRLSKYSETPRSLEPRDLAYADAMYQAEIAFVDAWFGRFDALLAELGVRDETVVAVVSDHGEEFQEHGSVLHEKLYATVTRVPLLVRGPGVPAGRVVEEVVETIDLAPSLLELAGLPAPPKMEGRSFVETWRGGAPADGIAISESPFFGLQRAVATDRFHLILHLDGSGRELFEYRDDPAEQRDLADADAAALTETARRLAAWGAGRPLPRSERSPGAETLPEDVVESLRALGYLK
ncbi:MAG: sulfatase [Acidobacteria bacterium]|nr:sulfatase [Acidobacteriota bacterium]